MKRILPILALLCFAGSACAANSAFVQKINPGHGTSVSLSSWSVGNITAGDTILVMGSCTATCTPTVIDNNSNNYVSRGQCTAGPGAIKVIWMFEAANVSATTHAQPTISVGSNSNGEAMAAEFSGLNASGAFDKMACGTLSSTTAWTSGNTASTTSTNEMVTGWMVGDSNQFSVLGSGFSAGCSGTGVGCSSNEFDLLEYKHVTAMGAQAATATTSGNSNGLAMCATFADASQPSATIPRRQGGVF